jgi:hypothetical protein
MILPSNVVENNLYTIGGEFINKDTYKDYQGYYYETGDRFYIGKEFNPNPIELIKKNSSEVNPLLANPKTATYGKLTGINLQQNKPKPISFSPTSDNFQQGYQIRYFAKKLNVTPILIREINQTDFFKLSTDPLYQTLEVKYTFDISDQQIADLNKKMPGLGAYIQGYVPPTSSDESLQA